MRRFLDEGNNTFTMATTFVRRVAVTLAAISMTALGAVSAAADPVTYQITPYNGVIYQVNGGSVRALS
ncbi:hypothetical protein [Miniimonas sp. S16]|uniref:hypothetical protein n=1 Tax=Miniimonas sp. S16 TaxID=2171623 RepID=UPI00131EE101|nr:hypothetical protein [Miniimonas sp. S16]